ncbi:S41 family peptidase [Amycolatopsis sp. NPDC059021]|uniref:S41 family peptidase n=1 Tax=Amycolatopsis sp. NPDC059021 TaxID=3346704 RepID=UPI00366EB1AF
MRVLGLLLSVALVAGLAGAAPTDRPVPAVYAYLDDAIALMRKNALDRDRVDWPVVRANALRMAGDATTTADTYPAIEYVIGALGNRHTFLIRPGAMPAPAASVIRVPSGRRVDDRVALIAVPGFQADPAGERRYVEEGVAAMRQLDSAASCGWIVDLRGDDGGAMWPMLTVLAPLLGDGTLGAFVSPDGTRTAWSVRDGRAELGGEGMTEERNPVRLSHPRPPVAVLTSGDTASSGEATLIAFRGQDNVRSFGRATGGYATGNETYSFADGAQLLLTTVRNADRTGRVYDGRPIAPDQLSPVKAPPGEAVEAARTWLHTRC